MNNTLKRLNAVGISLAKRPPPRNTLIAQHLAEIAQLCKMGIVSAQSNSKAQGYDYHTNLETEPLDFLSVDELRAIISFEDGDYA